MISGLVFITKEREIKKNTSEIGYSEGKFSKKEKDRNAAKRTCSIKIDIQQTAISTRHKGLVQFIKASVCNGEGKSQKNHFYTAEMVLFK